MAAENPVESLQDEATCPICLEYFTEPVTLGCGHNFCRACITQCWEGSDIAVYCPQCRETVQQRNLRLNRQLANMVEIAKRLSLQAKKGSGVEKVCEKHQEPLKLFCEEDQTPICLVCDRSRAHRAHAVVPIEDVPQEYKEKIQAHLKTLREEREKLLGLKVNGEERSQEYLTQTERQKILLEFQQLRQFLEEQERLLLAQLEKLDKEIVKTQNDNVTKLSEEISRLSELISEMEGKCQKPASEFLQVRLNRDPGLSQPEQNAGQSNVTLDPNMAHPQCILSKNQKSLDLPDNPERFDTYRCVLGCEGFTTGRHYWEVEVGDGEFWAVGVARESVSRKGGISRNPEGGIWALERWVDQYQALTSPETPLTLSQIPSRIRVYLDCEQGQVKFFDAGNEAPIFNFPPSSFTGERMRPWFQVVGSPFRVCS
uniref:Tripartite motif containing 39 n=1 Tax=Terrapene triunguis TaxID=2587831 RepID=A0A674JIL0_9SAUR